VLKVFADFNNRDRDGCLRLSLKGTAEDLALHGVSLSEGMMLEASDGDLWAVLRVRAPGPEGIWRGEVVGDIHDVDANPTHSTSFQIFRLRASGPEQAVRLLADTHPLLGGQVVTRNPLHAGSNLPEAWWSVEACTDDQDTLELACERLFSKLGSQRVELGHMTARLGLYLDFEFTIKGDVRGVMLVVPNSYLSMMAEMGADVSFDLYPDS